jgi:hypothetical protein
LLAEGLAVSQRAALMRSISAGLVDERYFFTARSIVKTTSTTLRLWL